MIAATSMEAMMMEDHHNESLRLELNELLRKQHDVLESRMLGTATEDELLEYEIRQEIIHELCKTLSHAASTTRQRAA